jgi:peptide deformylase
MPVPAHIPSWALAPKSLPTRVRRQLMYAAKGVGLAAPQVGINKRLMVFNPDGDSVKWINEMVLVNPQIIDASDGKEYMKEGCLSFPGMNGVVARHKWIRVEYTSVKGRKMKKKFKGWEAKVFQVIIIRM